MRKRENKKERIRESRERGVGGVRESKERRGRSQGVEREEKEKERGRRTR